jgi:hypothetical protein
MTPVKSLRQIFSRGATSWYTIQLQFKKKIHNTNDETKTDIVSLLSIYFYKGM